MTEPILHLYYDRGSLLLDEVSPDDLPFIEPFAKLDHRITQYRAKAYHYGPLLRELHEKKRPFIDEARAYSPTSFPLTHPLAPRPHQEEALHAWREAKGRGVVVLPTGAGKSILAIMAIEKVGRPTLIVVPTIDLMLQWQRELSRFFSLPIGLLGGGEKQIEAITVATYDSALLMMETIGNRIGFLICDECHHLPSPSYRYVAMMCLAPYRMGLTATPERTDQGELALYELMGSMCYRISIPELEGQYLAPYRVKQLYIPLDDESRLRYDAARATYLGFIRENNIVFRHPSDWARFIALAYRSKKGKAAIAAYREQKRLARSSRSKLDTLWELLRKHRNDRIILFTDDNATAYEIGQRFFLPVLTHHTRLKERKALLEKFRSGELPFLVTSKVLNEGVDVPEASVGIIVSGSGSVREHVQRLGRILRKTGDKEAILYELISENTSEESTGKRRRRHIAYQRSHSISGD